MTPKVFISYSWDNKSHKKWVKEFSTRLCCNGVNVKLDQWDAVPGELLTDFMEKEIRDNDFVLLICTPSYKNKSDGIEKGLAKYEGDIMKGEQIAKNNPQKFIPILRKGTLTESRPTWATNKIYIDLRTKKVFEEGFLTLLMTLYKNWDKPQVKKMPTWKLKLAKCHSDLISTPSYQQLEGLIELKLQTRFVYPMLKDSVDKNITYSEFAKIRQTRFIKIKPILEMLKKGELLTYGHTLSKEGNLPLDKGLMEHINTIFFTHINLTKLKPLIKIVEELIVEELIVAKKRKEKKFWQH